MSIASSHFSQVDNFQIKRINPHRSSSEGCALMRILQMRMCFTATGVDRNVEILGKSRISVVKTARKNPDFLIFD